MKESTKTTSTTLFEGLCFTLWRATLLLFSLLSVATSYPIQYDTESNSADEDQIVLERFRRNTGSNTTTLAPETTTLSWLEKASPYIYILPPILVGIPLLCCLCCCFKACCKCCDDDEEAKKLTSPNGSRTSSRVAPAIEATASTSQNN